VLSLRACPAGGAARCTQSAGRCNHARAARRRFASAWRATVKRAALGSLRHAPPRPALAPQATPAKGGGAPPSASAAALGVGAARAARAAVLRGVDDVRAALRVYDALGELGALAE